MIWWAAFIFYMACYFVTFPAALASVQRRYPLAANVYDGVWAGVIGSMGPAGLLAVVIVNVVYDGKPFKYGFQWKVNLGKKSGE